MKLPPVVPVPLEHLDPQTPPLTQLVSQWQKLWHLAVARQNHLAQHQQTLREVTMGFQNIFTIVKKLEKQCSSILLGLVL